jgi:hypothetical protein
LSRAFVRREWFRGLTGETEGNWLLAIPKGRWENNMKLDLKMDGDPWTGFVWLRTG